MTRIIGVPSSGRVPNLNRGGAFRCDGAKKRPPPSLEHMRRLAADHLGMTVSQRAPFVANACCHQLTMGETGMLHKYRCRVAEARFFLSRSYTRWHLIATNKMLALESELGMVQRDSLDPDGVFPSFLSKGSFLGADWIAQVDLQLSHSLSPSPSLSFVEFRAISLEQATT